MLSKNQLKLIRSLDTRKGRTKHGLFVAEGPKVVGDLLSAGFQAEIMTEDADDVAHASFLQHPQVVLAAFRIPNEDSSCAIPTDTLSLALDGVQDPGNLGTIIRLADWFGISDIFCSHDTADCWNPKVVQATMGSIARVRVHYTDLIAAVKSLPDDFPIYGTLLNGDNIYNVELSSTGLIVMGNEGKGLSEEMRHAVKHRLLIPNFPPGRHTADSLNVATATAIVLSEFRRRSYNSVS